VEKETYEVQTYFQLGGTWENVWSEEGNDGTERSQLFDTRQEAEDAISEFFADLGRAHMAHQYDREDYRVERVA